MSFCGLPREIQFWIFCQDAVADILVVPFLYWLKTNWAAQHRLVYNRDIIIKCQNKLEVLPTQYEYGVYGLVAQDLSSALILTLQLCLAPSCRLLAIIDHTRSVKINASFDDKNTADLADHLRRLLALLGGSCHKSVELQIMAKYWDPLATWCVLAAINNIASLPNVSASLQLHVPLWYLPAFARGCGTMKLHAVNIESVGTNNVLNTNNVLDDEVVFHVNAHLRKLKVSSNFYMPNMSFTSDRHACLSHLELNMPIQPHAEWVQNGHLLQFGKLEDLRLFTFTDLSCLFPMGNSKPMLRLKSLYVSFLDVVHSYSDFNFQAFAPALEFLYVSDKKATTTKRP